MVDALIDANVLGRGYAIIGIAAVLAVGGVLLFVLYKGGYIKLGKGKGSSSSNGDYSLY